MASLSDFDFSKYFIDPTLSDEEILDAVEKFPEFRGDLNHKILPKANVIRYIILMYDFNTEMREFFPDHMIRKRECAIMAGFKLKDGVFHDQVTEMLLGYNRVVNQMIMRYVRCFDDPDYLVYQSTWTMLINEIHSSMSPMDSKDLKTTRENIDNLHRRVNELAKSVFRGDDIRELKKLLYKGMEQEMLNLRPEDIARMFVRPDERREDNKDKKIELYIDPYNED